MKKFNSFLIVSVCTLMVFALFAGCSSDGSMPFAPKEEPTITIKKVTGLVLFCNREIVALVDNANVNGIVTLQSDQDSDVFEVEFIDENGEIINNDPQEYKLAWSYEDSQIAILDQHTDDLNEWQFHIHGKTPGYTTFQLQLENGGSVDYSSPAIPLEVK